jgi:hypothetical protein
MASDSNRRFVDTSDDEIVAKRLKLNLDNMIKSNQKSANILRECLLEKQQDPSFDTVRLNETLGHFYVDVRKPDGSKYKATSFESIRNGINRYLHAVSST